MSFSHDIKLEVLNQKMKQKHFVAFLNGLILTNTEYLNSKSEIIIKINKADVSFLIKEKLEKFNIKYFRTTKNKNWIVILKKDFKPVLKINEPQFFFAGCFVGGGSISDFYSSSYNLQISFFYEEVGKLLQEKLDQYDFEFSWYKRVNKYIIYNKKSEKIFDFLAAIKATNAFNLFFDTKATRDMKNNANRLVNLDVHNQHRLVKAVQKDKENYDFVVQNNYEEYFKFEELVFFKERILNADANLQQLCEIMLQKHRIQKTKSGFNHWLIKLNKFVKEKKEAQKEQK
ncbi:DNA-binding protein WhiA [Mycoplasma procyoni]|uniref:DNA-binding protein WhiA n=1 Tax=Mycoplasma procyoni TaxID=568784 RepID=UPI00197C04CD|nr:DNA-binding protein WhiA [Mycoplasma procyoni]MBN3534967.1 DNA-binding protein WhiA [Mycoplasma procyoni]